MPHAQASGFPSLCVWLSDRITPVGQDRRILTRSESGDPELQSWAQCLSVFVLTQGGITTETEL